MEETENDFIPKYFFGFLSIFRGFFGLQIKNKKINGNNFKVK